MKKRGGWLILLFFVEKRTSVACLLGSGLNDIFHWVALVIVCKSWLSSSAVKEGSLTVAKSKVSSAKKKIL